MDKFSEILLANSNWTPYDVAPGTGSITPQIANPLPQKNLRFALGDVPTMPVNMDQHTTKNDTWYKWLPYFHRAVVIGQPAISPTAAPMSRTHPNSWDWKFGIRGTYGTASPVVDSNKNLPVSTIPTMGM